MGKSLTAPAVWKATVFDTPLGAVTCQATQEGLCGVTFGKQEPAAGNFPQDDDAPAPVRQALQAALGQISAYLTGGLQQFSLPLDLSACTDFQRQVLDQVISIPYGQTRTYGQIAVKLGGMNKQRAVGGAVGSNPLPVVIPCHRVVAAGGRLQGYSGWGGIRTKAWLLQLEGQRLIAEELE